MTVAAHVFFYLQYLYLSMGNERGTPFFDICTPFLIGTLFLISTLFLIGTLFLMGFDIVRLTTY